MAQNSGVDVMRLLRSGIPLTLLMDLADPTGPRSEEILESERQRRMRVH
ncbi:MAG: hypothetical protein R2737_15620 [Candidatus Nanopelagicales bacterium]